MIAAASVFVKEGGIIPLQPSTGHAQTAYTTNGTTVDLYTCNGSGAQDWVTQPSGELVNPQSGKCLEDNDNGGSGTQLIIYDCNGAADQKWTLP